MNPASKKLPTPAATRSQTTRLTMALALAPWARQGRDLG